ncbi:HVA22-like protein i [Rutidosis leptorrhynchoides]|uniref:HVA22-like protein i n=1 Tax=Rutidosis leptorrhynchoides TaxID=125765 RepID=UPI003A99760E
MLGYMLNRVLMLLLAYLYPAYECFKNIEKNKPDVDSLRFWCQYWIIIALLTVWDSFGDAFVSWLPLYSEVKVVICVYLWYPKTKGTIYIYSTFVKPYLLKHEGDIDRTIAELKTRAGDSASLYIQRVLAYGQTRAVEIVQLVMTQSLQRAQPAPATASDNKASAAVSGSGEDGPVKLRKTGAVAK